MRQTPLALGTALLAAAGPVGCTTEMMGAGVENYFSGRAANKRALIAAVGPCSAQIGTPLPDAPTVARRAYDGPVRAREDAAVLAIKSRRLEGLSGVTLTAAALDGQSEFWEQAEDEPPKRARLEPACEPGESCSYVSVLPGSHRVRVSGKTLGTRVVSFSGQVRFAAVVGGLYSMRVCRLREDTTLLFWVRDERSLACVSTVCPGEARTPAPLPVPAPQTAAQVLQDLTPEQVRAALADEKAKGCYPVQGAAGACFTTPYSRVVALAANARRLNKTATEADVTPEIIAPGELHVHAFNGYWIGRGWGVARLEEAALIPAKSEDLRRAIVPARTLRPGTWIMEDFHKSIAGKKLPELATADRTLVFPLSVLGEGNELHLLFDHPVSCTYFINSHCTGRFDLKAVR